MIDTTSPKTNHMFHVHVRYILLHEIYKVGKNLEWAVLEDTLIMLGAKNFGGISKSGAPLMEEPDWFGDPG